MGNLAAGVQADIAVVGLIGERNREVSDFVHNLRGAGRMDRTIVIAATSDQSALIKRRASELVLRTAEHFRDLGRHVLCLFDSVTRFAEAHREIALSAGEAPALRAFPPSTAAAIAALCERAGPGSEGDAGGDITAVFSVLVAGSDMDEPVSDMVRAVLDGHVILDRSIAERGRFPAIDIRRSVSRSAPEAWTSEEEALAVKARKLIAAYEEAAPMIQAGLYTPGADPLLDEAVQLWPDLDPFIGAVSATPEEDGHVTRLGEILGMTPTPSILPEADNQEPAD
jgi:flagellum-specific ATP synthase